MHLLISLSCSLCYLPWRGKWMKMKTIWAIILLRYSVMLYLLHWETLKCHLLEFEERLRDFYFHFSESFPNLIVSSEITSGLFSLAKSTESHRLFLCWYDSWVIYCSSIFKTLVVSLNNLVRLSRKMFFKKPSIILISCN